MDIHQHLQQILPRYLSPEIWRDYLLAGSVFHFKDHISRGKVYEGTVFKQIELAFYDCILARQLIGIGFAHSITVMERRSRHECNVMSIGNQTAFALRGEMA